MTWSTVLTVTAVLIVVLIARRAGSRVAGAVAGLPTTVAPALLLLACSDVPDYAIRAAVAAMWASAAYATFALCYARICRHVALLPTTLIAVATSICTVLLLSKWPFSCNEALVFALLFCAVVRYFLPRHESTATATPHVNPRSPLSMSQVATVAGIVSVTVYALRAFVQPHVVGMLAAAPIVGATVAALAHRAEGPRAAQRLMAGYVDGCIAKIMFCFAFATLLQSQGIAISLIVALALCIACTVLLYRLNKFSERRIAKAATSMESGYAGGEQSMHANPITCLLAPRDITATITRPTRVLP